VASCNRTKRTEHCKQPALAGDNLCAAHRHWADNGIQPDSYYEQKIMAGVCQPTWLYMSDSEAHALLNGRYRGDGRRIDQYVTAEPLLIDPEAFTS